VAAQLGVAKFAGLADGERMLSLTKTPNWTRWAAAVRRCGWAVAVWLALGSAVAADSRPVVGPGATKEEVLDAYGWPTGLSQAGAKEILIYPQGRVVLDKGRVEVVDFTLKTPWPAPRPRPGATGGAATPTVAGPGESWFTSWPEAVKEAQRRRVRILTVFVGSDWSPPSRQFLTEVAEAPEFLTAFLGSFVLVKLDFPTRATQQKALREQNAELRERFEVTTYPAVVLMEPDGALATKVDLNKPQPGDTYRAQVITAVREARDALGPVPGGGPNGAAARSAKTKAGAETPVEARVAVPAGGSSALAGAAASLSEAGSALALGLGGGSILVVVMIWFFWRRKSLVVAHNSTAAERVADAASGLPSSVEMAEWSHFHVCAVVGVVAEADGYEVRKRGGGADGDLALTRTGETQPSVIVACAPAAAGPVSAKRLRELFGTITIDGVGTGWFVGMAGFSAEARDYAREHGLSLITRDGLREQLRALTEHDLARALSRGS
jgi:hypothetical protein